MNKLKTKILLLLSFLFLIILMIGIIGSQFISLLSKDSGEIIKNNYKSLEYCTNMLRMVDDLYTLHIQRDLLNIKSTPYKVQHLITQFNYNLRSEEQNITEAGEEAIVDRLRKDYLEFLNLINKSGGNSALKYDAELSQNYEDVRSSIAAIYKLNSDAVISRNNKAAETARQVTRYMIILTCISLLIALLLILYFPNYILRPVYRLTDKIKAVSAGDYNQRLEVSGNDELGALVKEFNTMSLKLSEYEQLNLHKLLIEKNRLGTIINSLNDGIFVLDENKRIASVNRTAERITGLTEKQAIGKFAAELVSGYSLLSEIFNGLIGTPGGQKEQPNEIIPVMINGIKASFSREVIQTRLEGESDSSGMTGFIIILKNVTTFEERDTAKTNLLATVSHELKTPLSSINLSVKLLEDPRTGPLSESHKKITGIIKEQSSRLSKMVNELLDYSQTESGNIKLKIVTTRAEEIIDYALTSLMLLISDKKIDVETNIEPGLPAVKADIEKTVWVLVNLISNAVRYTTENGLLQISCSRKGEYVQFSVSDNGPGIEPENLEKIFDKFVQIGSNPRGRGLGLAIAKEFVISQSGEIWAESEPGQGSSFHFRLPCAK